MEAIYSSMQIWPVFQFSKEDGARAFAFITLQAKRACEA